LVGKPLEKLQQVNKTRLQSYWSDLW